MNYKIIECVPPQVLVSYLDDAGKEVGILWIRIDLDESGNLPSGGALDEYIMSFAHQVIQPPAPQLEKDWSHIHALVEKPATVEPTNIAELMVAVEPNQ